MTRADKFVEQLQNIRKLYTSTNFIKKRALFLKSHLKDSFKLVPYTNLG